MLERSIIYALVTSLPQVPETVSLDDGIKVSTFEDLFITYHCFKNW